MKSTKLFQITKGLALIAVAGTMMGNQSCNPPTQESRQLRRRVQMGSVSSYVDKVKLPADAGGGVFNFDYAANASVQRALRETNTFSTVGAFVDPSKVSMKDSNEFHQCSFSNPSKAFEISDEAVCMMHQPQGLVTVNMTNFQFTGGINGDIPLTGLGALTGLSFDFKNARLDMELMATNPLIQGQLDKGHVLATAPSQGYFYDVKGGLHLDFGQIKLGLGGYLVSDMAKVVEKALASGFTKLRSDWNRNINSNDIGGGWYAMVLRDCDTGILINAGGGSDAGLKENDILAVYNVSYDWEGPRCNSRLRGTVQELRPVAFVRISAVGDTISRAQVIEDDPNYPRVDFPILPGARVYLKAWAPAEQPKK